MPGGQALGAKLLRPADVPVARNRWSGYDVWLAIAIIVFSTAAAYANSLGAGFIFDDYHDIVRSPEVRRGGAPWQAAVSTRGGKTVIHPRPVVVTSFALNYALGGLQAWQFHATNAAIHIVAALALFGIVRRTLLLPRPGSLAT